MGINIDYSNRALILTTGLGIILSIGMGLKLNSATKFTLSTGLRKILITGTRLILATVWGIDTVYWIGGLILTRGIGE